MSSNWPNLHWVMLQEPGCVPEMKGPFGSRFLPAFLRECMDARPTALLTVVTVDEGVPQFDEAGMWLTVADGRSVPRVQRWRARVKAEWRAALGLA